MPMSSIEPLGLVSSSSNISREVSSSFRRSSTGAPVAAAAESSSASPSASAASLEARSIRAAADTPVSSRQERIFRNSPPSTNTILVEVVPISTTRAVLSGS